MGQCVGVELGPHRIRAVRERRFGRPRFETLEVEWDGDDLDAAVETLRDRFGAGCRLGVAIAIDALYIKRLSLPPLDLAHRRRAVALDADRYFPVRSEDVVVSLGNTDLVFAVVLERLERWIAPLARVGSVERVEEAPAALARVCRRLRIAAASIVVAEAGDVGIGWVEVADGHVVAARRVRGKIDADDTPAGRVYLIPWRDRIAAEVSHALHRTVEPLPTPRGLDTRYAVAWGAAQGLDDEVAIALATPIVERRIVRRKRLKLATAWGALLAATLFGGYAVDRLRSRVERRLDAEIVALRGPAAEVVDLQREVEGRLETAGALAELSARRIAPLDVLLGVARLLPDDAFLRSVQGSGTDFQLDGYAPDAAPLVPLFEDSPLFEDAHFLGATRRVRMNERTYDGFSLAIRYARR